MRKSDDTRRPRLIRVFGIGSLLLMMVFYAGCSKRSHSTGEPDTGVVENDANVLTDVLRIDADPMACATGTGELAPMPVDIIIAIDTSASMGDEKAGVKENINVNLANILFASPLDFRVIMICQSFCMDPPLGNPNDCLASNPPLFYNVNHFVNNSDALTLFLWTFEGYGRQPNTCNHKDYDPDIMWSDKIRSDSMKVFIVVTDDDASSFDCANATAMCEEAAQTNPQMDCSGCYPSCPVGDYCPWHHCPTYADRPAAWGGADFPTELYNLPGNMFGQPEKPLWIFHSIIGVTQLLLPSDPLTPLNQVCNFSGNTAETSGVEYQKLSILTGGLRFPSCDTDYSPVFNQIASTIVPLACQYSVESTNLGEIDPQMTNVSFDPQDGTGPQIIPQDTSAPCDSGANGWQWNEDLTRVILCGPACDMVKSSAQGKVSITVGCKTIVR